MTYQTPCHNIGQQVLPTQPLPREEEDFSGGGKYSKGVPMPKGCASAHIANLLLTERYYSVGSIYVLWTSTQYYINLSLVLNSLYH